MKKVLLSLMFILSLALPTYTFAQDSTAVAPTEVTVATSQPVVTPDFSQAKTYLDSVKAALEVLQDPATKEMFTDFYNHAKDKPTDGDPQSWITWASGLWTGLGVLLTFLANLIYQKFIKKK